MERNATTNEIPSTTPVAFDVWRIDTGEALYTVEGVVSWMRAAPGEVCIALRAFVYPDGRRVPAHGVTCIMAERVRRI